MILPKLFILGLTFRNTCCIFRDKVLNGLPRDSKERLELCMDQNVPINIFLSKVETERIIANSRGESNVVPLTIKSHTWNPPVAQAQARESEEIMELKKKLDEMELAMSDIRKGKETVTSQAKISSKYCPTCRMNNHSSSECLRNPNNMCYDCHRVGCRRGKEGCPGRKSTTR